MELDKEINRLQDKIKLLEEENYSLSQNLENLLLINILNNQPAKSGSINFYQDTILEKLAILKSFPFTAICSCLEGVFFIESCYSLEDDTERHGFSLGIKLHCSIDEPYYLSNEDEQTVCEALKLSIERYDICIYPFNISNLGKRYLLLVNDSNAEVELNQIEQLIISFLNVLCVRLENLKLNNDLRKLNATLEEKVIERTRQVNIVNTQLQVEIEERKRRENEIVDNERKLSLIFNSTPLIMLLVDSNSNVTKINQTGLNIAGKEEVMLIGLQPGEILSCAYQLDEKTGCGKSSNCGSCTVRNSIRHTLQTRENLYKVEGKLFLENGGSTSEHDVLITTTYLDIPSKPSVYVCIDDITNRVKLEEDLRVKTTMLLKSQELALMGEFEYEVQNKQFKLSDNLKRILDIDDTFVSLESIVERIHPDERAELMMELTGALASKSSYSIQYRHYKINREERFLQSNAEIYRDKNGKAVYVFGVVMDVTEQKQAEIALSLKNNELTAAEEELTATNDALRDYLEELEKAKFKAEESDRLKSVFLANMSHEIRTPMNAIVGFSDLLDMEDMPFEKRKAYTKTIRERTKDLLNIINDLLDLSRIESNSLKIIPKKGNINAVLVEIKDFFELRNEQIFNKPIKFIVENNLELEHYNIETDFDRIKQVLINLIENAFKFTNSGQIKLKCSLADSGSLLLSVSDTGIGIPIDKKNLIFERFRQVEDSYLTREFGGVGLGLSICKGIVELMNGKIWVESEFGVGSTFSFTLPFKKVILKTEPNAMGNTRYYFGNKKILIVEDMQFNRDYLKEVLNGTDATLIFAPDGNTALMEFRSNTDIAIVLMDIRLPDIDGLELTRIMTKERQGIQIIAQTAYASGDDQEKCFDAGCVDILTKPILKKHLLEKLDNYLFSKI